ncbi:hypothetical protein JNN96_21150 [Mycobacterium sp. DSM 3803]|nr:hypothetical protein [Mycobacterium sp. DSM 3803]
MRRRGAGIRLAMTALLVAAATIGPAAPVAVADEPCPPPYAQGMPPCTASPVAACPPNMTSYWDGRPCTPLPCTPPYSPGLPPCIMAPQAPVP